MILLTNRNVSSIKNDLTEIDFPATTALQLLFDIQKYFLYSFKQLLL